MSVVATLSTGCGGGGTSGDSSIPGGDPSAFTPDWVEIAPAEVLAFHFDASDSDTDNGARLAAAILVLQPGQRLEIGTGTYSIINRFDISIEGTAGAPIWIAAQDGATPVITRPNAGQNTINVGDTGNGAAYLSFEGLEVTGGSTAFKLYDCSYLRIDDCHIHHIGGVGIAANSGNTDHLHITRNEIHHTGGAGEGMYLGANNAVWVMHDSVIARNHVHDCGGSQGDGIEVKQGSYGNVVSYNLVHDTNFPCILVYGTNGNARNLVEGNLCYRSATSVMQVQGEAIVRNNLLIDGLDTGFQSTDHQGQTRDLTFVHNTILTQTGRGANLSSWTGRDNMLFANNIVYSGGSNSIRFAGGDAGVTVAGNVVMGATQGVVASGYITGTGLSDFANVAWDGSSLDARPTADAIRFAADPTFVVSLDLNGNPRGAMPATGCLD